MSQITAIVTGATGSIGKAIAMKLAMNRNYKVILVCRNEKKAQNTVEEIQSVSGNPFIDYELVDLSNYSSIKALFKRWNQPLDILINNAAETPRQRQETPERLEKQFATNILGYLRLSKGFQDILMESSPSRIINVASYWAGDLDINDLQFTQRRYHNNTAYRQSKQANRMLTIALAERYKQLGITVNTCHPGDVNSALSNSLGFGGHQSPEQGAATPVWLATDPIGNSTTGKYFENKKITPCIFGRNIQAIEELYSLCETYC